MKSFKTVASVMLAFFVFGLACSSAQATYFSDYVGVGTTTPQFKLSIFSTTTTDKLFQIATTTNQSLFIVDNNGNIGIGVSTPVSKLDVNGNINISNPSRSILTSNGSVYGSMIGIGTTTSLYQLSIYNGSNIYNPGDTTWDFNSYDRTVDLNSNNAFYGSESALSFSNNSTTTPYAAIIGKAYGTGYGDGRIGFATNYNGVMATRLTISSDGQAGIISNANNNGKNLAINSNGYVGIGTTTPTDVLHVYGSATDAGKGAHINNGWMGMSPSSYNFFSMSSYPMRGTINSAAFSQEDIGNTLVNAASGKTVSIRSNNADIETLTASAVTIPTANLLVSAGKVGIGTTSPNRTLSVNGYIGLQSAGTEYGLMLATSNGLSIYGGGNGRILFNSGLTAPTEKMRITEYGYVGIGTNTPQRILDIQGASPQVRVFGTGGDTNINSFNLSTVGQSWTMGMNNSQIAGNANNLFFRDNDSTNLVITPSGNIGIGTTTPNEKLQVNGNLKVNGNIVSDGDICIGKCN